MFCGSTRIKTISKAKAILKQKSFMFSTNVANSFLIFFSFHPLLFKEINIYLFGLRKRIFRTRHILFSFFFVMSSIVVLYVCCVISMQDEKKSNSPVLKIILYFHKKLETLLSFHSF